MTSNEPKKDTLVHEGALVDTVAAVDLVNAMESRGIYEDTSTLSLRSNSIALGSTSCIPSRDDTTGRDDPYGVAHHGESIDLDSLHDPTEITEKEPNTENIFDSEKRAES